MQGRPSAFPARVLSFPGVSTAFTLLEFYLALPPHRPVWNLAVCLPGLAPSLSDVELGCVLTRTPSIRVRSVARSLAPRLHVLLSLWWV